LFDEFEVRSGAREAWVVVLVVVVHVLLLP